MSPSLLRPLLAAFVLTATCNARAQEVRLPAEIKGSVGAWIVVAPEVVDGGKPKWRIDPRLQEVRLDLLFPAELVSQAKGKVLTASKEGRYTIEAWNAKEDVASEIATCVVIIGNPPPGPTPPDPTPPVPPEPEPRPTPAGPRRVVILHESGDQTPIIGSLRTSLRIGQPGQYITEHSHSLEFLDDDSAKGKEWLTHLGEQSLPAIFIVDKALNKVVHKGSLPLTADAVISTLKAHGG